MTSMADITEQDEIEMGFCQHCNKYMPACSCLFCELCDAPCTEEDRVYVDMPGTFTGTMTVCEQCRTPEKE